MTRQGGVLPNFLIVGASRSGTTSLHHYLSRHGDIFMPRDKKELRFFDRDSNYERGLGFYQCHFVRWSGQKVVGEASPPYFFHGITFDRDGNQTFDPEDDAPSRIARALPESRILISLRNPVDRAYSQYWKNRAEGREFASTYRAALEEELAGRRSPRDTAACWVYKNSYSIHLQRWLDLFSESMCKIVVFEEWTSDTGALLSDLADFLEVDPGGMPKDFPVLNVGNFSRRDKLTSRIRQRLKRTGARRLMPRGPDLPSYPEMDLQTRHFALETFESDVAKVEKILGRSLEIWRSS